jgi:nucleotide-binding universal stress UspA family protein
MTTSAAHGAVVVGIDGTTHSDAALEWAVRYAATHRRPLLLVHAAGVPTVYESFAGPTENRKELRIAGRRTTDRALGLVTLQAPELEVRIHMALGSPKDVISGSLEGAHMLVLGSRGRGSLASFVLGSVSRGLSSHAPCPVAIIRPVMARMEDGAYSGRIVVGVDGTETSQAALGMAFELAASQGRELAVLHAWGHGGVQGDLASIETRAALIEEHKLVVAESLAGYAEKYPDVPVTQHHADREPGHALVAASHDAETVVVGARGRHDSAAVLFGSVSRHVVEHACCPVIVVRRDPGHEQ